MSGNKREPKPAGTGAWAEDQQKHDYYYDDSHGYQPYEPDQEDDVKDETPTPGSTDEKSRAPMKRPGVVIEQEVLD